MDDVLGAQARETDAIAALGRWRMRLRAQVLMVACVLGAGLAVGGLFIVTDWQFQAWGYAILLVTVGVGGALPFCVAILAGLFVGRRLIATRTESQLRHLAKRYDLDISELRETNLLLREL